MDGKDTDPADEWPLPPAWMWGCSECSVLYRAMKQAPEIVDAARAEGGPGIDWDPFDTVLTTQIKLAQHLAACHAQDLPDDDPECARCTSEELRQVSATLHDEHRARHLFAPPRIVGLM